MKKNVGVTRPKRLFTCFLNYLTQFDKTIMSNVFSTTISPSHKKIPKPLRRYRRGVNDIRKAFLTHLTSTRVEENNIIQVGQDKGQPTDDRSRLPVTLIGGKGYDDGF